jgi:plastocyanin
LAGAGFYFLRGPRQSTSIDGNNSIPAFPLSPDVSDPTPTAPPTTPKTSTKPTTPPTQVACTLEAKLCPDGSYVGRTGPNCEFAACPTPVREPVTHNVSIQSFSFGGPLAVKKGDTVIWTNRDSAPHTVTGEGGLASNAIYQSGTYSFTFDSVGVFNYYCTYHPSMKGTVTVSE